MNPEKKHDDRHNCAPLTMTKATMCINTPMNETGRRRHRRRHSSTTGCFIPFIVVLVLLICAFPSRTTAFRDSEGHIDTTDSNPDSSDGSVTDNSHDGPVKSSVVDKLNTQQRDGHGQNQQELPNGNQIPSGPGNDETVTSTVTTTRPSGLEAKHEDGFEALDVAILNGNLVIARELSKKMDIETYWVNDSASPLLWAAFLGRMNVMKELVNKGADMDTKGKNVDSPLHNASYNGHLDVVKLLVENKADVNAKGKNDKTPLHWASQNGRLIVVKFLVDNKADINAKDNNGDTPLHYASWKGQLYIVKFLVNNDVDINVKQNDGWTPLHRASEKGHLGVAWYLRSRGRGKFEVGVAFVVALLAVLIL